MQDSWSENFCGHTVDRKALIEIQEIVDTFNKLSRTELANTICELFEWKRPTGKLKTIECRQFLERLDEQGMIRLPEAEKIGRQKGDKVKVKRQKLDTYNKEIIRLRLNDLKPLRLEKIEDKDQRQLWYEYVDFYHYLGYNQPFGAQLRYFILSDARPDLVLGCLQFSSPAWKMAPRDKYIGWSDEQRKRNLQRIVNNSRFLILPYIRVKNLASSVLALAAKSIVRDWYDSYRYEPVLIESLVDPKMFKGTCYKAANYVYVGKTAGRGRFDKDNTQHGAARKEIFMYTLNPNFRQILQK